MSHPGHGHTPPDSVLHYLVEPTHAIVLLLIALASWLAVAWCLHHVDPCERPEHRGATPDGSSRSPLP